MREGRVQPIVADVIPRLVVTSEPEQELGSKPVSSVPPRPCFITDYRLCVRRALFPQVAFTMIMITATETQNTTQTKDTSKMKPKPSVTGPRVKVSL